MIKKADIALFFIILILGLAFSFFTLTFNEAGDKVLVSVDGEAYGTYALDEDKEIVVEQSGHTNHIIIKDGQVSMAYSTCKNQICVNTLAISETKDSIACLPNKVLIEIINKDGGDVDVITG